MTAQYIVPESVRRLWGVPTTNDLPPKWDGVPVTWRGWQVFESSMDFHLTLDQLACDKCGGLGEGTLINTGTRPNTEPEEGGPTQLRNITAFRCPHCGHDSIWDMATDLHWDLDPNDYGDEGSTETKDTLF